jgi:hypothetical protein
MAAIKRTKRSTIVDKALDRNLQIKQYERHVKLERSLSVLFAQMKGRIFNGIKSVNTPFGISK